MGILAGLEPQAKKFWPNKTNNLAGTASRTEAVPAGRCCYYYRSLFVRLCGKKCFLENRRDGSKYEVNYSYVNGLHVSFGRETKMGQSGTRGTNAKCGFRNVEWKKAAQQG